MKLSIELKVAIVVAAGFVALTIGAMAQGGIAEAKPVVRTGTAR